MAKTITFKVLTNGRCLMTVTEDNVSCSIPLSADDYLSGNHTNDRFHIWCKHLPGNLPGVDNVFSFAISEVDKANCSPVLSGTTTEGLVEEINTNCFPKPYAMLSAVSTAQVTEALGFSNAPNVLATISAINGKTVAATDLYTVPADKIAVITGVILRPTTATAITVEAEGSVGTNATDYDNIRAASAFTGLTAASTVYAQQFAGAIATAAAAEVVKLNITVGATGTTLTLQATLLGYLIDA